MATFVGVVVGCKICGSPVSRFRDGGEEASQEIE